MEFMQIELGDVSDADIPAIAAIYAHYVRTSAATFEIEPPAAGEMASRRAAIVARGMPYLVARIDDRVAGYAYASPYRSRAAYRFTVEDSIYVHPDAARQGIGRSLLSGLVARSAECGFRQMVALIGDTENAASIGLHQACGFRHAGVLTGVGLKFGRWVDTVLMQRALLPDDRASGPA